ncbi:MAG: NusG domain II-containing protein [Anaerovoracaceae bacterium]|jgi:hypothetical protein
MSKRTLPKLKVIRLADLILIAALVVCGLAAAFLLSQGKSIGGRVVVKVDGETFGTYDLLTDRTIDTGTGNIIAVEDGAVYMKSATCRGQDCVHQGKIRDTSQSIICLPHRVVVEIEGKEGEYDTIAR